MHRISGPQRHVKRAPSAIQRKRRNAYRTCCHHWNVGTHEEDRNTWQLYAVGSETAFNAYLRINLVRVFNGLLVLRRAPTD